MDKYGLGFVCGPDVIWTNTTANLTKIVGSPDTKGILASGPVEPVSYRLYVGFYRDTVLFVTVFREMSGYTIIICGSYLPVHSGSQTELVQQTCR